ncbi:hypothetical protein Ct9H90mP29_05380 [bacterium]|nr:MAG: hypothetical protein Ct9H90mP29_05380 [bacterium]
MFFAHFPLGGGVNITGQFGETFHHFFGETFFDVMDNLSSKYMLPVGGMFTAIFILMKWSVPSFINEIGPKYHWKDEDKTLVSILCGIAGIIVGFIIINEIIAKITGKAIIGWVMLLERIIPTTSSFYKEGRHIFHFLAKKLMRRDGYNFLRSGP